MKKTLIITLEYPPQIGGIATFVHQLANQLDPEQTIVLAPKVKNSLAWDSAVSYPVIRENLLFPRFIWPRWLKLFFIVHKLVKTYGVERIMVHHTLPVGYVAFLMKSMLGIPYIVFSHGTDVLVNTKSSWKKDMTRMVLRPCSQLLFNSHSLRSRLLAALPEFTDKSSVMYPCPDKDFFVAPESQMIELLRHKLALEGKQTILSVARIDEGKGFPHLVNIMPEVLKKVPNLVWIVIGNGPKRDEIYREIEKKHLQNVVRYMGDIPHSEIKSYYYLSDLFVLFTHPEHDGREEGLGLVFLEAAATGTAVIAGKSGGVEEAVVDGKTGILVDVYGDLSGAGETIAGLLKDKVKAQQMGAAGRERMQTEFAWETQLLVVKPWIE